MDLARRNTATAEIAAVTSEAYQRLLEVGMDPGAALVLLLPAGGAEERAATGAVRLADAIVWARLDATAQHHLRRGTARPEAVAALRAITSDGRLLEQAAAIALAGRPVAGDATGESCQVSRLLIDAGADRDRVLGQATSIVTERRRLDERLARRRRLR